MQEPIKWKFNLKDVLLKHGATAIAVGYGTKDGTESGKALLTTFLPPAFVTNICQNVNGLQLAFALALGTLVVSLVQTEKSEAVKEAVLEQRLESLQQAIEDISLNQVPGKRVAQKLRDWVRDGIDTKQLSSEQGTELISLIATTFESEETEAVDDTAAINAALDPIFAMIGEPEERRLSLRVLANYDRLPKDISPEVRRGLDAQIKRLVPGTNRTLFSSLDEILDKLAVKPGVLIPVPEGSRYQDRTAQISRLRYAERLVPRLIGRDAELKSLSEFRDHEEKFLYWIWYGDGGLGKSRLALEWLYQSLALGWQGGFVQNGFPPQMEQWQPNGPTIFIFDYAESSASRIGTVLRVMQTSKEQYEFPVRVLLLDRRYLESLDFARFIHGEGDASTDADFSCVSSSSRPISRARRLEQVSPEQFLEMFRLAVFNLSARRVAYSDEKLMEVFTWPEFDRRKLRPLYAGIAALAYVEQAAGSSFDPANLSDWSTDVLEGFVLKREARIWKEDVKASQTEVHGLTGACIMGEVPVGAKPVEGVDRAKVRKMANHTAQDTDYLQPEPLAETLVRTRLRGNALFGDTPTEVIQAATIELFRAAFLAAPGGN